MSDEQMSTLIDHENINHLSHMETNQDITLELQYNDSSLRSIEVSKNVRISLTATIYDLTKILLTLYQLKDKRPEDVTLIEIQYHQHCSTFKGNMNSKLSALNIHDGSILRFQPTIISLSELSSYLTIYMSNPSKNLQFQWYKTRTTLNNLLDYIIEKFSLKSIERDRIHLFHRVEEIDLSSNNDKLLKEIGIIDDDFIDVQITSPISSSISSLISNINNDNLSPLYEKRFIESLPYNDSNESIVIGLEYTDQFENSRTKQHGYSPKTKINDIIREFIETANLKNVSSDDVHCTGYKYNNNIYPMSSDERYSTLEEIKIKSGYTLLFKLSTSSTSKQSWSLTIESPNDSKKTIYEWYKTNTTLGELIEYIIKEFSLQSIDYKRICLRTSKNEELNHQLHSSQLLSDFNLKNFDSVIFTIISDSSLMIHNENSNVYVECNHKNGSKSFEISNTTIIEELKIRIGKQFEGYIITEYKLFDHMHRPIDITKQTQSISDFGVQPGQKVYAAIHLISTPNTPEKLNKINHGTQRSFSLIKKTQSNEITVNVKTSTREPQSIKVSIDDTVGDLLTKLERFKEHQLSTRFDIFCGSTHIDNEKVNQSLSDFGVTADDTIDVTLIHKTNYKLESSDESTSRLFNHSSRNQRFTSSPLGLANLGNTCYMNSALQCLAHTRPLTQFFLDGLKQITSGIVSNFDDTAKWNEFYNIGTITGAYADVLRNLYLPSQRVYSLFSYRPDHIREAIGNRAPRFATNDQQDVQEFLTYLLDEMHKEFKEKTECDSNTIIENLFFGKLQSTIICQECKHEVKSTNIFSLLSLPIHQKGFLFIVKFIKNNGFNESSIVTVPEDGQVKDIIETFMASFTFTSFRRSIIVMTDDGQVDLNMPVSQLSVKEVTLVEQDDFLNSLEFDRKFKSSKKLTLEICLENFCSIEYLEDSWLCPEENCNKHTVATKQLQFSSLPSILIIQLKRFSHENGIRDKLETFIEYPMKGLNLTNLLSSSSKENEAIYDLFAVSNHIGSIYAGHYTAYAQHELYGKIEWYKFDDAFTNLCWSESEVVSKNAYLLFYIRRDQSQQSTLITTS